jgi:hypothetical protein
MITSAKNIFQIRLAVIEFTSIKIGFRVRYAYCAENL